MNWEDTLLAHHAYASHFPQRLGHVVSMYLDVPPWKIVSKRPGAMDEKESWDPTKLDDQDLHYYNALDCVYTARSWKALQVDLEPERATYESDKRLAVLGRHMQEHGFAVDLEKREGLHHQLKGRERRQVAKLRQIARFDDLRPTKLVDLRKALFEKLHAPVLFRNIATGTASTNADTLQALATMEGKVGAFARTLLIWRDAQKLRSTYVDGIKPEKDGRVHPSWRSFGTVSGRFSCRDPNCFDGKTEVLTPEGWVRFDRLRKGLPVAQWKEGEITFARPAQYVTRFFRGTMVHVRNQHIDLMMTPDHRCLLQNRKTGEYRVFSASDYKSDWKQLNAGMLRRRRKKYRMSRIDCAMLTIICAVQADGSLRDGGINFNFIKRRKFLRLTEALKRTGTPFSTARYDRLYYVRILKGPIAKEMTSLLGRDRKFGSWILNLPRPAMDLFCKEVFLWDGCATRMNHYASRHSSDADWVQIALTLSGKRAHRRVYKPRNPRAALSYQIDVTHRDYSLTTNVKRSMVPHEGNVYCVSVPSGFLVVRRNGKVSVTGNCQNLKREGGSASIRSMFVAPPGRVLCSFDMSQLEMRMAAYLSGDEVFIRSCESEDIHSSNGVVLFGEMPPKYLGRADERVGRVNPEFKRLRDMAKEGGFAVAYLAEAQTVHARMIQKGFNIRLDAVVAMLNRMRRIYARYYEYQEENLRKVQEQGYLRTWGGRFRWFGFEPKPTDVANYPIQGGAADLLNRLLPEIEDQLPRGGSAFVVAQVHDQGIIECDKRLAMRVVKIVREVTGQKTKLGNGVEAYFPADVKIGTRWSEL